jgi:glycosyltransferase involved in cell wall biosynthesis
MVGQSSQQKETKMKDKLTIIIPSKNESDTLYDCLQFLYNQKDIDGVRIIVADISDDPYSVGILYKARSNFKDKLKIEIIKGGFPSEGRLAGSKLANTPYILFLDADVFLTNYNLLSDVFKKLQTNKIELLTTPFQTSKRWNWVFRIFDFLQIGSTLLKAPFAIGGFQLWDRQAYWKTGGYVKDELFAEDYSISSKSNPKYFHIHKTKGVWTSPRRFQNKGVFYMVSLMIQSYINRNNPEFFKQHHNYWI